VNVKAAIISGTMEHPFGYFSCPTHPVKVLNDKTLQLNVILGLKKPAMFPMYFQAALILQTVFS
jgi:hypothetical protein